jgi:hypothetical protein
MNFNDTKINNTNGFAIDYAFSDFSECQFCKKTVSKGNLKIAIIISSSFQKKQVIETDHFGKVITMIFYRYMSGFILNVFSLKSCNKK